MNAPGIQTIIVAAALLPWSGSLQAACQFKEVSSGNSQVGVIENDLVTVRLLPEQGGSIDDFHFKANPLMTLFPFQEKREEVIRGTGIYSQQIVSANGCRDAIWRGGADLFSKVPYQLQALEKDSKQVRIKMTMDSELWRGERQIALVDGSSCLDLTVRLTSKKSELIEKSYWLQCMLRLADTLLSMPGDDSEIVLFPARRESKTVQSVTVPVDSPRVIWRNPEDGKNCFVAPGQPWCAALDRTEKLLLGLVVDIPDFPADAVFYSWPGDRQVYSMEVIFPFTRFEPGKAVEYHAKLMILQGLNDLHYLCGRYALQVVKSTGEGGNPSLHLAVLSPQAGSSATFRLLLRKGEVETLSVPIDMKGLGPTKPVYAKVNISAPPPAGTYELWIEESGKKIPLLGQTVSFK